QFIATVNAINPKGKTPIADSLLHAAEVLKYRDNNATVVLISDGLESCHGDPCAVAAELEQKGMDFTAHVVGFDLDEAGNQALACIADNTGGIFVPASNAAELKDALQQVQARVVQKEAAPEPKPAPEPQQAAQAEATLAATDQEGGPEIQEGLRWTVRHGATGEVILETEDAGVVTAELPPGVHDVTVERIADGATEEAELELPPGGTRLTIPIVVKVAASVQAPASASAGSQVRVTWSGPDEKNDYVGVFKPDDDNSAEIHYFHTKAGNPANLKLPEEPGTYEIRYILDKNRQDLARQTIEATTVDATLEAPDSAPAGSQVRITWSGPDYPNDYVGVFKVDDGNSAEIHYFYTAEGNPANLKMPEQPGIYEIRYVLNSSRQDLARRTIEATTVGASLEAPGSAPAGSQVRVTWSGPDYANDYVGVFKPDDDNSAEIHYFYTADGNPANLKLPEEPGTYEIRYVLNSSRQDLARRTVEATPISASLDVPASAAAGSDVRVVWEGPDYKNDYIAVFGPGDGNNAEIHYFYTAEGNPANLKMPEEPGTYEIRYVLNSSRQDLARRTIEVTSP
ncbi:MAG: hypothetical protein M0Q87_04735, partial [Ottowia sp.]|nr:hypothetical protein [Ottowia sp.]